MVDSKRREILVTGASGGSPPKFGGDALPPADEVVAEMRRVYQQPSVPRFLDATAIELLSEARQTFDRLGLRDHSVCRHGDQLLLFTWVGGRAQRALVLALAARKIVATSHDLAVVVPAKDLHTLLAALNELARGPAPDPVALARLVPDMQLAKYDSYLGVDLLARCFASKHIDAARVPAVAADLLGRIPRRLLDY